MNRTARIGLYIGTESDSTNQYTERLLNGWGRCLSQYNVDAFGSADLPDSVTDQYNRYRTKVRRHRTAFTKIASVYQDTMEYISERDPDLLIQFRTYTAHATGVALAGWHHNIPVITRYQADSLNAYQAASFHLRPGVFALHNICGRIPIRLSKKQITLGPYGKSSLISAGASPDDVVIIPPPRDQTGRFRPVENKSKIKQKLGLPADRPIALYVGKMTKRKGMEFLRKVLKLVIPKTEICFVLVGPGPYEKKFDEAFDDKQVKTVGHIDYSDIDQYYKSADVYIHPSAYEGIPLTILESWDCGISVIAREAGDIGFLINDTITTPKEMAGKILSGDWETEWKNQEQFELDHQRKKLVQLIDNIVKI